MYTVVNIPLASILPALTDDPNERTVLATRRKFLAFLGSTIVSATALTMVNLVGKGNEALGFRVVMGVFGVIGCICFFLTFALVRETNLKETTKSASLKETIVSLAHNTPWKLFALNILFQWTGYFIQSSALVYYYKYYVGSTQMSSLVATIMTMIPMVAIKAMYIYIPIVLLILSLITMSFYKLDKELPQIQEEFDEEKKLFVSGADKQISWASQVWMALADVFGDKQKNAELLERTIQENPEIRMVTPYMYHHFIEALMQNDRKELAVQYMREYWGGMLEDGADTFWELYDPKNKDLKPYGSQMVNSYCHAWSCAPAYMIRKYLI